MIKTTSSKYATLDKQSIQYMCQDIKDSIKLNKSLCVLCKHCIDLRYDYDHRIPKRYQNYSSELLCRRYPTSDVDFVNGCRDEMDHRECKTINSMGDCELFSLHDKYICLEDLPDVWWRRLLHKIKLR